MSSERDNKLEAVLEAAAQWPSACELLLTAFSTSLGHYRRSSVCTPFPRHLWPATPDEAGQKDFTGACNILKQLPAVQELQQHAVLEKLTADRLELLYWLFHVRLSSRQLQMQLISEKTFRDELNGMLVFPRLSSFTPSHILKMSSQGKANWSPRETVYAFHGTSMENLHSILHNGLLNLSGTTLQRTGAIFGDGIYCTTDMEVAFSFSGPSSSGPWGGCALGERLRVLLVCQVRDRNANGSLPDKYIVVKATDEIRLSHILVYVDKHTGNNASKRKGLGLSLETLVIVAYVVVLVCVGISQNFHIQRWLVSIIGASYV